jgi:hypothetical protein
MSTIYWFENPAFDAPELNSPQPCIHGAGCVFTVKNADVISPGCCRYVHPGEEGTGRRLFPAKDGKPACVRLIAAGFYERRRLRLPWSEWCALKGIPYVRNEPGVRHEPVKRLPFSLGRQIADGAVKRMSDPVAKARILADVAAHVQRPEWAGTMATLAAEYAYGVREGVATLAEPHLDMYPAASSDDFDPDYICTFCHAKEIECGGDHGDEMRDWQRESLDRDW